MSKSKNSTEPSDEFKYFIDVGEMRYYSATPEGAKLRAQTQLDGIHVPLPKPDRDFAADYLFHWTKANDVADRVELQRRVASLDERLDRLTTSIMVQVEYPKGPWWRRFKAWLRSKLTP